MTPALKAVHVPPNWRRIAFASDIHLSAHDAETAARWHHALAALQADALFLLGDYFDFWVGDDALDAPVTTGPDGETLAFWQSCVRALHATAQRLPVYWMVGNRDFLVGERFAQATGVHRLQDPCCLHWAQDTYLLSHGDTWCTDDLAYMAFRKQVRSADWQQGFLQQSLAQRLAAARGMRKTSQARQQNMPAIADVHADAVNQSAAAHQATAVIHGHTHQGRSFALPSGRARHVTLDWDAPAARAQWLWLTPEGLTRVDWPGTETRG